MTGGLPAPCALAISARAASAHAAADQGSAPSRTPYRRWGARASSSGVGRAVRTRRSRYTCALSPFTTVPPTRSARASASADLPLAVGPAMRNKGGFVVTLFLLAPGTLAPSHVEAARGLLAALAPGAPEWLEPSRACAIPLERWSRHAEARLRAALPGVDAVARAHDAPEPRLFVADMDSTMIAVECIDELAGYAGLKAEVAAITERAMRGELPFAEALHARVALLAGLPVEVVDDCRRTCVVLSPGAKVLVRTLGARGVRCVLASGGFTAFADPVAAELGFHEVRANRLEMEDGRLTGRLLGTLVDADAKRAALVEAARALHADAATVVAIGDGANDLPMVRAAGVGVAYRAKPALAEAAVARLDHAELDALLHVLGVPRGAWADA